MVLLIEQNHLYSPLKFQWEIIKNKLLSVIPSVNLRNPGKAGTFVLRLHRIAACTEWWFCLQQMLLAKVVCKNSFLRNPNLLFPNLQWDIIMFIQFNTKKQRYILFSHILINYKKLWFTHLASGTKSASTDLLLLIYTCTLGNWDSSFSIAMGYGVDDWGSIPGRARDF